MKEKDISNTKNISNNKNDSNKPDDSNHSNYLNNSNKKNAANKSNIPITESEWQVLKVLWRENPLALPQIVRRLEHTGWSVNTIQTFLSRLVKKSAISTVKQGRGFLYSPAVPEQDCRISQAKRLVDRVFDGSVSSMVMGVFESGDISEEEFEKLRKLVEDYRGKSGKGQKSK